MTIDSGGDAAADGGGYGAPDNKGIDNRSMENRRPARTRRGPSGLTGADPEPAPSPPTASPAVRPTAEAQTAPASALAPASASAPLQTPAAQPPSQAEPGSLTAKTGELLPTVRSGLIQTTLNADSIDTGAAIAEKMLAKHLPMIDEAGRKGVQILCLQELFNGPYFCPSQDPKWYDMAEPVPDGPTTKVMQEYARKHNMVIIVPLFEKDITGVYYNTAAVIDADGTYLGKYRKNHLPQVAGFWEKFFFKPGNLGYPIFRTAYADIGVYICYDRHFPEGARALGLNGAHIVYNPSATVAGLSQYLWKLEQPAHAVANGYFLGAINRVGTEAPWNIGKFYGSSYFVNPRGQIVAQASEDKDELLIADLNLEEVKEVRDLWQFYRDRRPETYEQIARL